jgi:hypothetical protein
VFQLLCQQQRWIATLGTNNLPLEGKLFFKTSFGTVEDDNLIGKRYTNPKVLAILY